MVLSWLLKRDGNDVHLTLNVGGNEFPLTEEAVRDLLRNKVAKNPKHKPRPHSFPDPFLRAGKFSRGFAKSFPQKIVLAKPSPYFARRLPESSRAEPPKKTPFQFFKIFPPPNQKCKRRFLRGCRRVREAVSAGEMQTRQSKTILLEERICFASAHSDLARFGFRRAGGCGRNARRILLNFWTGVAKKKVCLNQNCYSRLFKIVKR